MEKRITLKNEFNSLDKVFDFAKKESAFECSKAYDIWDVRTDPNGEMEECIVIKKSAMHGMKVFLAGENELKASYIIPNKLMNAYFGKSQKARKGILDLIAGQVKNYFWLDHRKKHLKKWNKPLTK